MYSPAVISGLVPVSEGSGLGVVVCVSVGIESIAGTGLPLEPARIFKELQRKGMSSAHPET